MPEATIIVSPASSGFGAVDGLEEPAVRHAAPWEGKSGMFDPEVGVAQCGLRCVDVHFSVAWGGEPFGDQAFVDEIKRQRKALAAEEDEVNAVSSGLAVSVATY